MLRRIPGLEIGADGSITFNGQKVDKLLVDGGGIFGTSPTVVTRNFNAGLISKIQLFDKKSDRAQFTGIDDGNGVKTLNLTIIGPGIASNAGSSRCCRRSGISIRPGDGSNRKNSCRMLAVFITK